jgi:hypothetical protein
LAVNYQNYRGVHKLTLSNDLQALLEAEENNTVGNAFGGPSQPGASKSYSVAKIRDWLVEQQFNDGSPLAQALDNAKVTCTPALFKVVVSNLIRFSFLIELTNLTVGSTKMKTRWLPGLILMPQDGSFEPIRGNFEPGNDPRSSDYATCEMVFCRALEILCDNINCDQELRVELLSLRVNSSIAYELPFGYIDPSLKPVHVPNNVHWIFGEDIRWLMRARPILFAPLPRSLKNKIQTKTYKTDRALTGKDKTNRAKRWEVLYEDFQHASLSQCWSVEKKLLSELLFFDGFPQDALEAANSAGLVERRETSRCPVTCAPFGPAFEWRVCHKETDDAQEQVHRGTDHRDPG